MTAVRVTVEAGIARVVLSRPPLNILTREVLGCLHDELIRLENDRLLRVLLLTAEGKHFSAGADVGEHLPPEYEEMIPEFLATVAAIDMFALPVVAVVRGRCLGGGFELVQAADVVIAGESATFAQPEIMLGVFPPAACALLPDRSPRGVAAELVLTGDPITAEDAKNVGLVRRVVPDDQLDEVADELANRIARHSAAALRLAKRALKSGLRSRRAVALRDAEEIYINELMHTADATEGLRAFQEKRAPVWSHR